MVAPTESSVAASAEAAPVSDARLRANRLNARKSTGPQTPEGKARSSKNALKHGFCSTDIFIEGEDPIEYHRFRLEMLRFTRPRNILEEQFAEQIIRGSWKLKRLQVAELDLYRDRAATIRREAPDAVIPDGYLLGGLLWSADTEFRGFLRYERQMTSMMHRGMDQLRKLRTDDMPGVLNEHAGALIAAEEATLQDLEQNEPNSEQDDASAEQSESSASDGEQMHTDNQVVNGLEAPEAPIPEASAPVSSG